jgi:hypothetical protein
LELFFAAFSELIGEFFEKVLAAHESKPDHSGPNVAGYNEFHFAVTHPVGVMPALVFNLFHFDLSANIQGKNQTHKKKHGKL